MPLMLTLRSLRPVLFAVVTPFMRFWGKLWMRLWGCTVPASARINGRPLLWMHRGRLVIGERVAISSVSAIYEPGQTFSRCMFSTTPDGLIEIGDDSHLSGVVISAHKSVTIGKRVMIGGGTRILDSQYHPIDTLPRIPSTAPEARPIVIEDDVWLSLDVLVLPGVRIGRGSVIGARSVVTSDIPPMVVAAGIPAKVIRPVRLPGASMEVDTATDSILPRASALSPPLQAFDSVFAQTAASAQAPRARGKPF